MLPDCASCRSASRSSESAPAQSRTAQRTDASSWVAVAVPHRSRAESSSARDDARCRRASRPIVERHRDLAEVHLGPAEHDLTGDAPDGETCAQITLGGTELAARAKQIAAPLQRARVAGEIAGGAQPLDGAAEQHLGGVGAPNAELLAPEDVVRHAFDARGASSAREPKRRVGERTGARRSTRENELRAIRERERAPDRIAGGSTRAARSSIASPASTPCVRPRSSASRANAAPSALSSPAAAPSARRWRAENRFPRAATVARVRARSRCAPRRRSPSGRVPRRREQWRGEESAAA